VKIHHVFIFVVTDEFNMKYVHRCPKPTNLTYVHRFSTSPMNVNCAGVDMDLATYVHRSCHVTDEFKPRKFVVDVA
jgi:hypothetical protein